MLLGLPRNTSCLHIGGTNTFRLASKAWLKRWGTNLQNIEKSIRRLYVPDDGYIFVQVDQSGAEALIVAYLCRAGNYRKLFEYRVKPHVFVALHLFSEIWDKELKEFSGEHKLHIEEFTELKIEELTLHPRWKEVDKLIKSSDGWPPARRYYYISKQVCHSSNYDVKAPTFALNTLEKSRGKIVLSIKDCDRYLNFYHCELFPEIREWHKETADIVRETRILSNLFGFPRYFGGELNEFNLKECYAFVPQSTVGTITNVSVTRLQEHIERHNLQWDILANTHDSYLCQCPIGEENICADKMQEIINQSFTYRGTTFSMKSEAVAGYNWSPHSDKNPNGLKELILN